MTVRPTPSLVRAVVVAAAAILIGVVTQRLDLVIVGLPFVIYCAWATLVRPPRELPAPTLAPAHAVLHEGDAAELTVGVPAGLVGTASLPMLNQVRFAPAYGAVIGSPDSGVPVTLRFEPLRWGRYTVGPATIAVTDPAGAWRASGQTGSASFSVRPHAMTLEGQTGVARPIGIAGVHASSSRGDGSAMADIREFVPGDRLRHINWKVTSRTRRMHVTETYVDRDTSVLIVADTQLDLADPDERAASSLDLTVRAIAAISRHYVSFGDRVGVHDLGHAIGSVRPGTGSRQARIILQMLSKASRSQDLLLRARRVRRLSAGTLVFVCSPLLDRDVLDEIVRLRVLGGEVIVVDTLPDGLGRSTWLGRDQEWLAEGWMLRRFEREATIQRLRELGIPVTPWRGPSSLGTVLMAMATARSAPRLRSGA